MRNEKIILEEGIYSLEFFKAIPYYREQYGKMGVVLAFIEQNSGEPISRTLSFPKGLKSALWDSYMIPLIGRNFTEDLKLLEPRGLAKLISDRARGKSFKGHLKPSICGQYNNLESLLGKDQ